MTDPRAIEEQTRHYRRIKEALLVRCPDLAEDETALFDTLEGESDLREMLVAVERSRQDDEVLIVGLEHRLQTMTTRLHRYRQRSDAKRETLRVSMEQSGLDKIEEPDFTISLRRVPAPLVISDPGLIPEKYQEVQYTILKKLIRLDLQNGVAVPGAQLGNGGLTINIRTK